MYKILGYCALPECGREFTIRHGLCCSKRHRVEYSRRKNKGTLHEIPQRLSIIERTEIKKGLKNNPGDRKLFYQTTAHRECVRAYQARKRQAYSKWANKTEMRKFYELAEERFLETGIKHEVDHIIPLAGKNVCGLHNEFNLQVLTKDENRKKRNFLLSE